MISKCTPLPGVSDHEMILTISDVQAKRLKPVTRKILLWNKADIQNNRNDLSAFSSNYLTSVTINTPIEEQWRIISRHPTQTIDNLVPSKMSTTRLNEPWITRQIKRLASQKIKITQQDKTIRRSPRLATVQNTQETDAIRLSKNPSEICR